MTAITFTARHVPDASEASSQCAVLPVFTRKSLSTAAQQVDQASGGSISALLSLGDFAGKRGETYLLSGSGAPSGCC